MSVRIKKKQFNEEQESDYATRLMKAAVDNMTVEIPEPMVLAKLDERVRLEYRDRGKFEAQLQVANDILIFQMHTDVFEFDANHLIWQNPYVQSDRENSYCGLINIYNFLSDSFKFNRNADEGFLIGRIFSHSSQPQRSAQVRYRRGANMPRSHACAR